MPFGHNPLWSGGQGTIPPFGRPKAVPAARPKAIGISGTCPRLYACIARPGAAKHCQNNNAATVFGLRKPLAESKVLIAGTVRDCANRVVRELGQIRRAFGAAKVARALIIESDSTDATCRELQKHFDADPWGEVCGLGKLEPKYPLRTARLAYCRNQYLSAFLNRPDYRDFDLLVVADLDGVNRHVTQAAVASCWTIPDPWDVVTANQLGAYYDLWALRVRDWCPDDSIVLYRRLLRFADERSARRLAIEARRLAVREDAGAIETESSFGCLSIYRKEILTSGARYDGLDASGQEVCEHVSLNRGIRAAGGRIFINPAFITRIRVRGAGTLMRAVNARLLG